MNTISDQTCTKCQNCGEWTNYADDPHHKARMAQAIADGAALDDIALGAARRIACLLDGSIRDISQLKAQVQVEVREALKQAVGRT